MEGRVLGSVLGHDPGRQIGPNYSCCIVTMQLLALFNHIRITSDEQTADGLSDTQGTALSSLLKPVNRTSGRKKKKTNFLWRS